MATDIAADGALLLRDDSGHEHVVTVGDVVHLRPER
jgi:biotin-(acetyl-CoA carboxylase) ligase